MFLYIVQYVRHTSITAQSSDGLGHFSSLWCLEAYCEFLHFVVISLMMAIHYSRNA